jgi:hypothetical protein
VHGLLDFDPRLGLRPLLLLFRLVAVFALVGPIRVELAFLAAQQLLAQVQQALALALDEMPAQSG